jgi:hypothetical protein
VNPTAGGAPHADDLLYYPAAMRSSAASIAALKRPVGLHPSKVEAIMLPASEALVYQATAGPMSRGCPMASITAWISPNADKEYPKEKLLPLREEAFAAS